MKSLRFLDLFAGIGGFRMGLENAGHVCVGHVEIDKFANKSYDAIYRPRKEEFFHNDITKLTDEHVRRLKELRIDLITGGFPCQAFSIAGARRGFEDTRGTLFFDIARLAREIRPAYLLLENVKGLLNHAGGDTYETILRALDDIGYDAEWEVLNSKDFGVPQNRERVFIVGHLRGRGGRKVFPIGESNGAAAGIQGQTVGTITTRTGEAASVGSYVVENKQHAQIKQNGNIKKTDSFGGNPQTGRVYGIDGLSPTLNTMQGGGLEPKIAVPVISPDRINKNQNGRRFKENGEPMFTLTAQDRHGVAIMRPKRTDYGKQIRKQYEAGEVEESRHNMTTLEPVFDGCSNTVTTVQKDNLLFVPKTMVRETDDGFHLCRNDEKKSSIQGTHVTYPDGTSHCLTSAHKPMTIDQQCVRSSNSSTVPMKQSNFRIRKLTPKECWRLQGFPDWAFDRARGAGVSDSQLYKQAGNSVTVNVVEAIGRKLVMEDRS